VHCTAYAVSPIFGSGCLQPLASKLISLAIVFSSCFIKVPVFKNVASIWNKNNKASKGKKPLSMGLSTLSIYTELLMFTNATLYGLLSAYPLLAFGETLTQAIQTIVLIAVVAMATGTVGRTIPKLAIFGGYVFAGERASAGGVVTKVCKICKATTNPSFGSAWQFTPCCRLSTTSG
jgi:hypothetical protein